MGRALGGFIYLMDAYDDLERDAKRGSFNALAALAKGLPAPAFEARCKALLEQHGILQRTEGKYTQNSCKFAILPTILTAVSSERLEAAVAMLQKEEKEGKEEEDDEEAEEDSAG